MIRHDTYAKWPLCCYQTGYRQYCLDQLQEIVTNYAPDALFLDIFGASLCYCPDCRHNFQAMFGYELPVHFTVGDAANRDIMTFLRHNEKSFLTEIRQKLAAIDPSLAITINFASHYPADLRNMLDYQFCEPLLGDNWFSAAYSRDTAQDRYPLLMPGEFSQVYNYPSYDKYIVELSEIAAKGCRVGMYSGSQHVDGSLEMEEARRVGAAFSAIEAMWPYIESREPVAYAAIIQSEISLSVGIDKFPQDAILRTKAPSPHLQAILGAMKLCDRQNIPWRIYTEEQFSQCDQSEIGVVLLPKVFVVSERLSADLEDYVSRGGLVIGTADSGIYNDNLSLRTARGSEEQGEGQGEIYSVLSGLFGIRQSRLNQTFSQNGWGAYLQPGDFFRDDGLLAVTTPPVSASWYEIELAAQTHSLLDFIQPAVAVDDEHWVNWWSPPPKANKTIKTSPALSSHEQGQGLALCLAFDLFGMADNGSYVYLHDLFRKILALAPRTPGIRLDLNHNQVRTHLAKRNQQILIHQISQLPKIIEGQSPSVSGGILSIDPEWLKHILGTADYTCSQVYPDNKVICSGHLDQDLQNRKPIEIQLPELQIQQIIVIGSMVPGYFSGN